VPVSAAGPAPLRVVIAEDAVLLREGLSRLLADAGMDVAGTAGDAGRLLQLVAALRPAVVLADIRMPPTQTTEGLKAARQIRQLWPGTAVVVLSQHVETEVLFDLLADDPRGIGYVLKDESLTSSSSPAQSAGSPVVSRSSTLRWSPGWSHGSARTVRCEP